jgi:predicted RNase H-like HicB family nuclease
MSPEDLFAAYPSIRQAIAFVEFYGLLPELHAEVSQGRSLQELIESLSDVINESIQEDNPPNPPNR